MFGKARIVPWDPSPQLPLRRPPMAAGLVSSAGRLWWKGTYADDGGIRVPCGFHRRCVVVVVFCELLVLIVCVVRVPLGAADVPVRM